MKFKFRLEKTAQFFSKKEKAKELELARVKFEMEKIQGQISQLENENRVVFSSNTIKQEIPAAWAKILLDRVDLNLQAMSQLSDEVAKIRDVFDLKKKELVEISQRRKALEKLRDKKLGEFKMLRSRKEQKQLDENYQLLELRKK